VCPPKASAIITSSEEPLMPTLNLKPQKLQCAFCSTVLTRGTGLSAHVRTQHPREYGKWNKNPNRLLDAATAASAQKEPRKNRLVRRVPPPATVKIREEAVSAPTIQEEPTVFAAPAPQIRDNNGSEALSLLQKAYDQLSSRKQTIESEIARIEGLRGEHEAVTAQVAALDQAMKAFHQ
jgi:BED zinc finger